MANKARRAHWVSVMLRVPPQLREALTGAVQADPKNRSQTDFLVDAIEAEVKRAIARSKQGPRALHLEG